MKDWFVYIVECADRTYYTGVSNDVEARVMAHNSGKGAKYTKGRVPVKLVFQETYIGRSEAQAREAKIKKMSRKAKKKMVESW